MKTRWLLAALAAASALTPAMAAAQSTGETRDRAEARAARGERARDWREGRIERRAPDASVAPAWTRPERGPVPSIETAPRPPQAQRERPSWRGGTWRGDSGAPQNPGASAQAQDWAAQRRGGWRGDDRQPRANDGAPIGGGFMNDRFRDLARQRDQQNGQYDRDNNGQWDRFEGRRDDRRDRDTSNWRRDPRYGSPQGSVYDPRYGSRYGGYDPRYGSNYGTGWSRDWRRDSRYDWYGYRQRYNNLYRLPRYYAPYSGYGYRRLSIGLTLGSGFFGSRYYINDPWAYRLPQAYGPYRWVRYWDDALLIDLRTGRVVDVVYGIFW